MGLPSTQCKDRRLERAAIEANAGDAGRGGFENPGPSTRFPSSSSTETPMSFEKQWERTVTSSGSTSPQAVYPQFPFPSAAAADGEVEEPVL